MATFPSLTPSSRTFTPGRYPHSEIPTLSGLQTRVRTSNVILEQSLRLSFAGLTETEMLSIRTHYVGQQGRFLSFAIPNDLLSGMSAPASFTPIGYSWTYVAPPQISDVACGRYDVAVELATVPPEGANVNGAEFTVAASIAGGGSSVEYAGLNLTATITFAAGAADGGGNTTYTWTTPNTTNPTADTYRLYGYGFARLSTTTSAGYKKDELIAGLTSGRSIEVQVNSVTHTGTVSTAGALEDAGTSTERVIVTFSVSPSFSDTTAGDTAMVLTLL
jgi:hypothetical protein